MPAASLLVFADDWGRHPSSCQHLVRRLLPRYPVTWVNTIGMRAPRVDVATFQRGWEKLRHWTRGRRDSEDLPHNLRVLAPKMWPWFRSRLDRRLNRELLRRQLTPVARSLRSPVVALTTLPVLADLVGVLPVDRWVYYCVDDFGEWPGLDRAALQQLDDDLICKADRLVAVSNTLQQKIKQRGRQSELLTHGVDLDYWQVNENDAVPELDRFERPLVLFWGVIDRRMDLAFLECLAGRLNRGSIVLVGPEADPDPRLFALPRVRRVPPVPFDRLPHLAGAADVLIMPYADLPVTRAMQPLKLKEYLAAGKPAVVRDLPATRSWSDGADLASLPEQFADLVIERLRTGLPEPQAAARKRLAEESWQAKASLLEHWTLLETPHGNGVCCA
jgi:glycosyltransferase involved in cell wall biosynthesis